MSNSVDIYLDKQVWFTLRSRDGMNQGHVRELLRGFKRGESERRIQCGCRNRPYMYVSGDTRGRRTLKRYPDQPSHSPDCPILTFFSLKLPDFKPSGMKPLGFTPKVDVRRPGALEFKIEMESPHCASLLQAMATSYNEGFFRPKWNFPDRGYSGCHCHEFALRMGEQFTSDWFPAVKAEYAELERMVVFSLGNISLNQFSSRSIHNRQPIFLPIYINLLDKPSVIPFFAECAVSDLVHGVRLGKMLGGRYLRPPYLGVALMFDGLLVEPTLLPVAFAPDRIRVCFVESEGEREHAYMLWKERKRFFSPATLEGYNLAGKDWNPFPDKVAPFRFDFLVCHKKASRWEIHEVANMHTAHYDQVIMPARRYAIGSLNLPVSFFEYRKEGNNWRKF